MSKLSDAIDVLQEIVDSHEPVPVYCHEDLELVLGAAWMYLDLRDGDDE